MSNDTLSADERAEKDLRLTNYALMPFLAFGVVIILIRYIFEGANALAIAMMWGASCLISGAFLGFLFCIPRVVEPKTETDKTKGGEQDGANGLRSDETGDSSSSRLQVNSNLVEISDWLTKIIVGLGLINLTKIPAELSNTAEVLAAGLASSSDCTDSGSCEHYAFALALIVAFSVLGFFMGYLYTRLFLAGAFHRADSGSGAIRRAVDSAIRASNAPIEKTTSPSQVAVAEQVKSLVAKEDSDSVVDQLQQYARNYDQLRLQVGGPGRTQKMTRVLVEMRTLALAAYDELPRFAESTRAGERLVAIAMLQVKPMRSRVDWLIERLTTETPFMSYAAAEALRRAASVFTSEPDKSDLGRKLSAFVRTTAGQQFVHAGHDRAAVLGDVLRQLDISIGPPESPS